MLWTQRRGLALGMAIGLLWSLGKVAVPKLTSRAVDGAVLGDESLLRWSLLIGVAGVVAGLATAARRFYAFRESRGTETRLREQLFAQIQRLHIGYHDRTQTGQLMSRASSDLQQIQGFVVMIPLTASNLAMVAAVVVVLAVQQPFLTLIALAPLPLLNVLATRFSHSIHPAVLAVQVEQGQLATVVEEAVSGVRVVKGFGAEKVIAERLLVEADDIRRESLKAARIRSAFLPALDLLPNVGLIAVLGIGGHRVLAGQMSRGELLEFMLYIGLLVFPLRNLGMTLAFGQRAAVALKRVNEVLSTVPAVADPPTPRALPKVGPTDPTRATGAVHFDHVSFAYGDDALVLDDFDLTIAAGTSVALVGSTGSGKSTVARLLVRFYDAKRGSIEIDGVDVRDLRLGELRRAVSVVFEDTFLFHDTVAANIAFAAPDAPQETIERAARLAGAHDFILELPNGYGTLLGERGFSLSGGQRQRVALARAIVADPRVLVLDDATSAVDPSKEHEIRESMATVMRGRTTIVIAHRAGTIALADTVVLLDSGRVAAVGRHQELLDTNEQYRNVLVALAAADDDDDDASSVAEVSDVAR
jgi:ATP-binding cassette, subfamily B, bacterial